MTVEETRQGVKRVWRGLGVDVAVLLAIGVLMGILGPFDSERMPLLTRHLYWQACILGGGVIGVTLDELARGWIRHAWRRVVAVSLAMTPLVALHVMIVVRVSRGFWPDGADYLRLQGQVLAISLAVMAVRALVWREAPARIETRTVIAPPLPEAEAVFRRRLSARRRAARLIAVEAHDHYLKVHTDTGAEMITLRFVDALAELDKAHGWRVHRSWWVAADAVEAVRWRRGGGEARLIGGLTAPVSRTYAPVLREAGWF